MSEAAPETPAEPVEVTQEAPSNAPAPEPEPAAPAAPPSLDEAAAALLVLVDEGHKTGDADVDAARADLRAALGDKALPTRDERAATDADAARAEAQAATDATLTPDAEVTGG